VCREGGRRGLDELGGGYGLAKGRNWAGWGADSLEREGLVVGGSQSSMCRECRVKEAGIGRGYGASGGGRDAGGGRCAGMDGIGG